MVIENGHVVSIDYTLKDETGKIVDSSEGSGPLSFIQGAGAVIPGMEKAVMGKDEGESFSVTIPAEEGYGDHNGELIFTLKKDKIDGIESFEEGMQVQAQTQEGTQILTVTEIYDESVQFDGNHPLAGKDLHFDITIDSVREATPEEKEHGHVH